MNPQQNPEQIKAQMQEQLRVITFLHSQKTRQHDANYALIQAINEGMSDLTAMFPTPVVKAYVETILTQQNQLAWEMDNLMSDISKIREILLQIDSPILRVVPTPVPPGPRNIR